MIAIDNFRTALSRYVTGETVSVLASFTDVVSVDTRRGVPIVVLNNGAVARYESGSGTNTLVFSYTVSESDRSVAALKVLAVAENDAVLTSGSGESVDVSVRRSGAQANDAVVSGVLDLPVSVESVSSTQQTDQLPPKLLSVSADSGVYREGDKLQLEVSFNEVVRVDVSQDAGLPTLSLSAGGELLPVVASYAGGSGTKTLRFQYEVSEGDPIATALNVSSFNLNGGAVTDISGNLADVAIVAGQNALPSSVSISIDGQNSLLDASPMSLASASDDVVPAFIQSIAAVEGDGTYQAGDKLTFRVQLSESVTVDAGNGIPMLVLSNGGIATYTGGSGSDELTFTYHVRASDRNADQLRVLGVAENDATLLDAGGNATDVRVSETNNLNVTSQVKISAQAPYIRTIDGIEGIYQPGDEIQLEVRLSEAVSVSGTPTLRLSNGGTASYVSGTGTDTLVFSYTVGAGASFSSADLDVSSLGLSTGGIVSVNSGNGVSTVVRPGILALSSDVVIDATPPTGTVSIDATALKKGESATVTLTFSEPVANPLSALEISNGTLDSLVTDETSEPGTVWKGTFRPDQDIESLSNTIVLDNSKVMDNPPADFGEGQDPSEWSFGNYGVGLSESDVFAIDTQSPVAQISSETLAGEGAVTNRLITVDFGEPVTGLTSSAITVSGGRKVPGTFTELTSGVYQLVVAPVEGAGTDADTLSFGVSLLADAVMDSAGNSNVQLPATTFTWDEAAPRIASIASTSGSYVTGDVVAFEVAFDEVVSVSTPAGGLVPSLALSNGALAHYVSGTNTDTLRFEYVVASGDEATDLSVLALFENDGGIADASGNAAKVAIGSGNGLPGSTSILIDGVVPTITTMRSDDGLYLPGDEIAIEVQFSEAVHVDESEGSPVLALSNGALATYVGGSETDVLHFTYVVAEGDYDAQDLDVLAFAEEGSRVREYFGETDGQLELGDNANVAIRGEINSLAYRSEVNVDSALPMIGQISANAGAYNAGDVIEIALSWSKGVSIDTTQGEPSLLLSNGALATYVPSLSSSTKLLFRYTVSENDAESGDLGIEAFRHGNARFEGVIAGGEALLVLPEQGLSPDGVLTIDLTPPEVVRFELSDTALSAGESATVTIELSEAVQQLSNGYVTVAHGVLSRFEAQDEAGLLWQATYTPYGDVTALDQVIRLDQGQLQDLSGNLGEGEAHSSVYQLDSAYPTVAISSDTVGMTKEPVRFVLNFSETVTGFDPATDVVIEGGSLEAWSIETPDNSGRPEGEYSFIVTPSANSVSPIKVRVPEGVAFDEAGNANARSQVFVQPIDTQKAYIESIEAPEGDYTYGDTIELSVTFSEPLSLALEPGLSAHALPELFLNNGQTARYVSGSGTDSWVFEYTVAPLINSQGESESIDTLTLRAMSLIENDTVLQDAVGNGAQVHIGTHNGLVDAVSIDTTAPVIAGFSATEGVVYGLGDVLWIRAELSEAVVISTGQTAPSLTLANGGIATYVTGHNSNDLLFRYVVSQGDSDSDQLAVSAFNTHDSTVEDRAGNTVDVTLLAGGNDLAASHTIVIDATAPVLQGVRLVETVDPLTNTDTDAAVDGYYGMDKTVAFEVDFDSGVLVDTTHGSPILTLSNGELATYVSGSGSSILRFEYTVSEAHVNTRALEVIGLAEQGALITDAASNEAIVDIDTDQLHYTTLVIDTKRPTGTLEVSATETVTSISTPVTLTLRFDEAMDVATLGVDDLRLSVSASTQVGDGQGGSGDASLFDASGMIVPDSLIQVSPTEFTVELLTPDLVRGELIIDIDQDAIRDQAGNPLTADLQVHYAVDTLTTSLVIVPVAGPFDGSQAQVALYRTDGQPLTENVDYVIDPAGDAADGQVQITLLNGYRGPLLVAVNDQDTQASDYQDELTQQAKSLDTVLRTMVFIEEPAAEVAPIEIVVSPLTELATRKAGYAQGEIPTDLSAQAIAYNDKVAALFNLQGVDIARTRVTTTLDDTFDASDGLDASEAYGDALATLSALDALTGSVRATIEQIVAGSTEQPVADSDETALVFDSGVAKVIEQSANVVDLMQDVGVDTTLTSEQALARADALRAVIRTAAGEAPLVSTTQLQDLGVPGVTDTTLSLAQRLISQTADDGSEVDTIAKIDDLLADALVALDKIITAADANTALDAEDPITAEHYAALGFIDRSPLIIAAYNRALNTDGVFIDTLGSLPDLEHFIATYDNLVAYAQDPNTADHAPQTADYLTLGITGTEKTDLLPIFNYALTSDQQPAVLDAAAMQRLVDNLSEAIDSFQRYSQDPINEAEPTPETYQKLLLAGSDAVVASINSLLADSDVLIGADVRTEMQHLIDTYNAFADYVAQEPGASAPTLADYATLGLVQLTDARAEAFLASFWPTVTLTDITDASQLDAYAEAVNALLATTDASVESVQQDPHAITTTQLALLGITVEPSDLSAVQAYIADQPDTAVADITALNQLVDVVLNAAERIIAYSQDPSAALDTYNGGLGAPTEQDYAVVLTGTGVTVDAVDAVNTALADSDITLGTDTVNGDLQSELKTVVLAYNALLDAADSLDDDDAISIQQLTEVGVGNISTDGDMNSLLLDVIDQRQPAAVDSTTELQALNDAINALEDTLANGPQATPPISDTQLALLGINGATVDNLDAIQITLAEGASSDYPTLAALQARVTKTVTALDKLTQHSVLDADPATNPVLQDYLDAGISGVSDTVLAQDVDGTDNLLAVNAQLRLVSDSADKNSAAEIQALVTAANDAINYLTTTIQALTTAPATGAVGAGEVSVDDQLAAYTAAGITGVSADNLLAVNAQLRLETTAGNKDSVSDIQAIVAKANTALAYLITTIQPLTTAPAAGTEGNGELSVDDQLAAYTAAGITGVSADNLLAVNAQLRLETTAGNKDSVSDIQAIVAKANTALALIEEYNNGDGSTVLTNTTASNQTVLTKADYEAAGITGVSDTVVDTGNSTDGTDNLAAVNAQVLLSDTGEANTAAKIQALVTAANDAINYLTTTIQALTTAPATGAVGAGEVSVDDQLAAYTAAGITGVSADNLLAVNAQLRLETTAENKDSVSDIQAIVAKANTALALIEEYNNGDGSTVLTNTTASNQTVLTKADYEAAGITGVSDTVVDTGNSTDGTDNLAAVNAQVLLSDTGEANTAAKIQALVTAANDAITYLTTTIQALTTAPATGAVGAGEVSVDDQLAAYIAAGITGVTADNLLAVNAQLRLEATAENKDSVSEIQAIVAKADAALALIEEYNNGDGSTVLTNTTGTNQTVLTKADYEAVGVTGVDDTAGSDNLAAVNAQVLLASAGGADSVADIQALVSAGNNAITYLTTTIQPLTTTTGSLDEAAQLAAYGAAGVTGVTADNLLAVNAQLRLESTAENKDSVSEIQALVAKADAAIALIEEYNNGNGSTVLANGATTLTVADYAAAGITGVSDTAVDVGTSIDGTDNLAAVNAQVLLSDMGGADSIAEIQALVTAGDDALSYLTTTIQPLTTAPAAGSAGSGEISVDDQLAAYAAAGITGVSADNLLAVNAQLRLETAATNKNSVSEIEAIVAKADAALAYLTTVIQPLTTAPAAGTEGSGELSVDDQLAAYAAAGITGVSVDNLLAVNAQLRLEATAANKDSVSEIQAIVAKANTAIALIEEYNNGDGSTALANGASTLTVADYEAVGVTGVADAAGTDNLAAVNAQVLLASAGGADSVADIQALVTAGDAALAYLTSTVQTQTDTVTLTSAAQLAAYAAAGVTGVSADNLLAVNAQLRLESTVTNKDSVSEIQAIVAKADAAIALIEEYNNGDGSTVLANGARTLTLADYEAAGITGVSDTAVDVGTSIDGTDNLAAVNAQVLLSDMGGADSIAEIQALVTAGDDALSYLTTTIQPLTTAPAAGSAGSGEISVDAQLAAYAAAGITGVSADNLLAVNAQLRLETAATNKNSVSEIEAIVAKADAAIALIEEYNNGDGNTALDNGATTLTIPDYEAAGIVGVEANNLFAVNWVMLAASTGSADSVGEIQALANTGIQAQIDALAKISAFADTLATSTETVAGDTDSFETQTLSVPSLTANAGYTLKVGNVILESGALDSDPSIAELITALQSDAAYILAPFTVAAHSTNANDLVITFKNVGERNVVAELRSEMPAVIDYQNSGATGATAENLYAANDGLMARSATQADSTAEVQSLLNAAQTVYTTNLNKVLAYAEGTNTVKLSVRTYKLAGLTAVTEASLSAVNKIVEAEDSSTINDFATAATYVNNGVQAYEAALLKLANYANEVANAATPDLTDYETAGITGLQAGDIDMINALMIQREAIDDGIATTTTGIQSIVNQGLTAIVKIRDAAENNSAATLIADDYEAVGVAVADIVNVGALNDALNSVAVTGADVRAYADLMAVVNAVKAVDVLADGTDDNGTVDLTAADFAAMGVTGLDATTTPESAEQTARLAILNDVLDRKDNNTTAYPGGDADEVAEVQALHDAAQAVLRTAKGETPKITEDQLELLGFGTVSATDITAENLSAIQQVLINTYTASSDFTGLNTLAKIETLTKNAVDALEAIKANADANNSSNDTTNTGLDLNGSSTGLDAADFAAMGVTTVTDSGTGSANNLAMVLSVLDSTVIKATEVTTYEKVQAIVDSVNTILTYVETGSAAPKISDFTTLGLPNITTVDQLTLINSYLNDSNTAVTDIDSYDELQARLTAVNHILADAAITDRAGIDAAVTASDSYDTDDTDLAALGFTYDVSSALLSGGNALADITDKNIDSIRLAIANSANDLSELQTFGALKTLIEDTAKAANTIQAYGAGVSGAAAPNEDDYAAIGVTGVTSLNVAAINSSLAETGVLDTITSSVAAEAQDIVNTWAKVQALADGQKNLSTSGLTELTATDLGSIGLILDSSTENQISSLLSDVIDTKTFASLNDVNALQGYVDVLEALVVTTALDYDPTGQTTVGTSDEGNGTRTDSSGNPYITLAQLELLGVGVLTDNPRTINGSSSQTTRYDDALEFIADGTTALSNDWNIYKTALVGAIDGLSSLEEVAILNNAIEADVATPSYVDYAPLGSFNPWGSSSGSVSLTNNWGSETLSTYSLISQTNSNWQFYMYSYNGTWTSWAQYSYTRGENGSISGGRVDRGQSANNLGSPSFTKGNNPTYGTYNDSVSVSINQINIDTVKTLNSVLNTEAIDSVDFSLLQTAKTTYRTILTAADGNSAAGTVLSLTADEYTNIGITGLAATSGESAKQTAKLAILNHAIEGLAKTTVDTIPELQKVFDAADALLRTIDGETPAITQAELSLLGFTGVTANNLSAIQKALSDVDTSSNYDAVDTLAEVTAFVDNAVTALAAISDAALDNDADTRTDGVDTTAGLTADDFVAMGVEGVDAANLPLILSALNSADIDNTDIFNLATTQALVNAAAKVVALAGDASAPKLVAADLSKLGVDLTSLDSGNVKANALALLNDLIIADSTAQTAVAGIQTLVTALGALIDDVAEATAASLDLATTDLAALGFNATSTDLVSGTTPTANITTNNIQAIRLALSATADDLSDLTSLSALQTLVNDIAKAANKIENYAEASTTPTDAGLIPSVADFAAVGVTGVDSTNLSAVLDAVANQSSITADITAEVQTLVDAYANFILVADGADDDDTAIVEQDYTDLGITLSTDATVKAAQLTVLADVYDVKSYGEIDTIAELQAIADAVKSVLDTAKLDVTTTDFTSYGASIAELELLGIVRVTNDNLASVRWILADAYNQAAAGAKFDGLDELPEIQSLIAKVVNALDVVTAYAADNSNPVPGVQTYKFAGVQGVTEDNVEAVNRQVDAAERSDVDTVAKLQTVVDAGLAAHLAVVNKIAEYANPLVTATSIESGDSSFAADGTRTDATPAQQSLALSGLTLTSDDVLTLRVGTTTLASDPLAGNTATDLLAALQASANYSDAPFTLSLNGDSTSLLLDWKVWGEVTDTATLRSEQPSLDDYLLAGLQIAARTSDGVTAENLYAVNADVEAATLTAVADDATVDQVKTLLDSVDTKVDAGILAKTTAFTKIETFADNTGGTAPAPTVADYALANIAGVTVDNLLAVNTRLKAGNSTPGSALTEAQINAAIIDADSRLAQFENNTPTAPAIAFTKADYEAIGFQGVKDTSGIDNLRAVNVQVALAANTDADTILDLQWAVARADAAIANIEAYNNGTLGRELTVDDYAAASLTGVTETTLYAVNQEIKYDKNLTLDSVSEIQVRVDRGIAAQADALKLIQSLAAGDVVGDGTLRDYVPRIDGTSDPDFANMVQYGLDYRSGSGWAAWKVFNDNYTAGNENALHSEGVSSYTDWRDGIVRPGSYIGWANPSDPYTYVLKSVTIYDKFANNMPAVFNIEGRVPGSGVWEVIKRITSPITNAANGDPVYQIAQTQTPSSYYQSYALPFSARAAYNGFRISPETIVNEDYLLINELVFLVERRAELSTDDFATAGVSGVTDTIAAALSAQVASAGLTNPTIGDIEALIPEALAMSAATLMTYQAAGFSEITLAIVDMVNADIRQARANGQTITADLVNDAIEVRRLYQNILENESASFATDSAKTELLSLVEAVHAISAMTSVADYDAQKATGFALDAAGIQTLLGASFTDTQPTVESFVENLVNLNRPVMSLYDLQQIASDATHIVRLEAYDEYGYVTFAESPSEFSDQIEELRAVIYLDEAVLEGELLQLVIDGTVVDELTITAGNRDDQQATLTASKGEFEAGSDNAVDIVVKTVNAVTGNETVSDIWEQTLG